jgi:hypothetical protein
MPCVTYESVRMNGELWIGILPARAGNRPFAGKSEET